MAVHKGVYGSNGYVHTGSPLFTVLFDVIGEKNLRVQVEPFHLTPRSAPAYLKEQVGHSVPRLEEALWAIRNDRSHLVLRDLVGLISRESEGGKRSLNVTVGEDPLDYVLDRSVHAQSISFWDEAKERAHVFSVRRSNYSKVFAAKGENYTGEFEGLGWNLNNSYVQLPDEQAARPFIERIVDAFRK